MHCWVWYCYAAILIVSLMRDHYMVIMTMHGSVWHCYTAASIVFGRRFAAPPLHGNHDTRVLVPGYQRVVPVLRARLGDISPARHELLVRVRARELACDGRVHGLHDLEVGGEEDVEVALVDLVLVSMRC